MLDELLADPGVEEHVELAGRFGIMALHGGIEAGTFEIGRAVAAAAGASFYAILMPADVWWHVPSTKFDPRHSPGLTRFLTHVDAVASLHGFGRPGFERTLLLGGQNRPLAGRFGDALRSVRRLAVVDDLTSIPKNLRGVHAANPVNLPSRRGVQIEMSSDVRTGGVADAITTALTGAVSTEMRSLCVECDD